MKNFLLTLFCTISSIFYSQDILYFDDDWNVVKEKKKASYYREVGKQGDYYLIKDYYIDGALQMEGLASVITPGDEVFEGKVVWYYPNGNVSGFTTYKNGVFFGESKLYDIEGRVLSDMNYKSFNDFDGKYYSYADEYNNNSIVEYRGGIIRKSLIFDKKLDGIRSEAIYDEEGNNIETKFYGENGRYIGSYKKVKGNDYAYYGKYVEYYANPMKVSSIKEYDDKGELLKYDEYYRSGKISKKYSKKGAIETDVWYDETGKILAKLDSKDGAAYEGVFIGKNSSNVIVSRIVYKNGEIVEDKRYDDKGKLANEFIYGDKSYLKEVISYKNGNQVGKMYYDSYGNELDGVYIDNYVEEHYKDGVKQKELRYNDNGDIVYERKLVDGNINRYKVKIYDIDKRNLKYEYTTISSGYDYFSAEIIPYDKSGKPLSRVIIKDGLVEKGKLKIEYTNKTIEYSRQGKWQIIRTYNDKNKLVKEEKVSQGEDDEYLGKQVIYEYDINEYLLN